MQTGQDDAMQLVRAELAARVDLLEAQLGERRRPLRSEEARQLAVAAECYGLTGVRRLADGLATAIGHGARGAEARAWLERLREAVSADREGAPQAGDAWLAAVMVRLAG